MSDKYAELRAALAAGPTPGPYRQSEHTPQRVDTGEGAINIGWACNVDNGARESRAEATAALIAACEPDTIRELLAERDQLAAALEEAQKDTARLDKLASLVGCKYSYGIYLSDVHLVWGDAITPRDLRSAIDAMEAKP